MLHDGVGRSSAILQAQIVPSDSQQCNGAPPNAGRGGSMIVNNSFNSLFGEIQMQVNCTLQTLYWFSGGLSFPKLQLELKDSFGALQSEVSMIPNS